MSNPKSVNPKIAELQADIETITTTINDPDTPEDVRKELRESLVEVEKELKALQKPKAAKPKKPKVAKPEVRLGDKLFKDTTSQELEEAFGKRMARVKEVEGKSKTKSIFTFKQVQPPAPQKAEVTEAASNG